MLFRSRRIAVCQNRFADPDAFTPNSVIVRQLAQRWGSMTPKGNLMLMRRFTRLTNAFSKKLENLQAAVALHFSHYNLVRLHKTTRVTPAMAANVTDRLWSIEELVDRTSR